MTNQDKQRKKLVTDAQNTSFKIAAIAKALNGFLSEGEFLPDHETPILDINTSDAIVFTWMLLDLCKEQQNRLDMLEKTI